MDPTVDPLVQLRGLLDLAIRELPDFLLALDMAKELEVPGTARLRRGIFAEGETVIGRYIAAVRPGMTPEAARDVAGLVLALLVGSHEIGDAVPATVATTRERITASPCAPSSSLSRSSRPASIGPWGTADPSRGTVRSALGFGRSGAILPTKHRLREEPR